MDKSPIKTPYTPSQKKRYEVSKDEFSTRRIQVLRDIYRELQAVLPIPISISVFGSLVKGKQLKADNARDADIDIDLKFDKEALNALSLDDTSRFTTRFKIDTVDGVIQDSDLIEFIRKSIVEKIHTVKDQLGLQEITENHLFITPISSSSIQSAVNARMMTAASEIPVVGGNADVRLARFFGLSIGSAVKKYRNKFLKELSESEDRLEDAADTWDLIRDAVERSERQGQIPIDIKRQFPQTLNEALKFYGVK